MKIWVISQSANNNYDTYDSAVVAAETAEDAKRIDPSGFCVWDDDRQSWAYQNKDGSLRTASGEGWAKHIDQVHAEVIGEAAPGIGTGVILASFNAG